MENNVDVYAHYSKLCPYTVVALLKEGRRMMNPVPRCWTSWGNQRRLGGVGRRFAKYLNANLSREEMKRGGLVTAAGAWGVVDPVEYDERQAADHEDDSHD